MGTATHPDWTAWLRRWDTQQSAQLPDREERFSAMLDVLDVLLPPDFVALDLASGPGSISQRLLTRFPQANAVAVDLDPLLLALGQGAIGTMDGRLRWVDADLTSPDWVTAVGPSRIDAVLSTTALHWLPTDDLIRVYRQLGELLRPGGVLLNGDNLRFGPQLESFRRVVTTVRERRQAAGVGRPAVETWDGWWKALAEAEPAAEPLLAERERRFAWRVALRQTGWTPPGYALHAAALQEADFREVGVIWQHLDNRVLMAVR